MTRVSRLHLWGSRVRFAQGGLGNGAEGDPHLASAGGCSKNLRAQEPPETVTAADGHRPLTGSTARHWAKSGSRLHTPGLLEPTVSSCKDTSIALEIAALEQAPATVATAGAQESMEGTRVAACPWPQTDGPSSLPWPQGWTSRRLQVSKASPKRPHICFQASGDTGGTAAVQVAFWRGLETV